MIKINKNSQKLMLIIAMITAMAVVLFWVAKPEETGTDFVLNETLPQQKTIQSVATESYEPVASDSHAHSVNSQTPITEADIRYQKLVTLMSSSMSEMSQTEQSAAIEQILAELPLVVRDGKINPNDAMFAHSVLLERQNVVVNEAMMQDIQRKYASLYPKDASARSEPHFD